jgi:protocatechuate 3,4-dioxygenase beta subunit
MYFPDDPLHSLDPILSSIPTEAARKRLVATYDHSVTEPEWALGYRWDIVLRGAQATPFETPEVQ